MEDSRVRKVTAVVLRHRNVQPEVLVFDHPLDGGGFMIQLPAGTVEQGEEPDLAAARELMEETGVKALPEFLAGVRDEEWESQNRRRWIYVFDAPEGLADEWPFTCDCGADTRCYWLPFERAEIFKPQQPWIDLAREQLAARSRGRT